MSGVVPAIPRLKFTNAAGVPVASGSVTVYLAGTTTLANTYQDKALTIQNNNPVPLDGNGEALFWLDPSLTYKFLLKDSLGATITGWPVDNILGGGQAPTLQQSYVDPFSGDGVQTIFTLSATPGSIKDTNVYVGGVYQKKSAYTLAGNVLTFTAAPVSGTNNIEVTYYVLLNFTTLAATIAGYSNAASASATAAATSRAQMLYIVQGSFAPGTPPTHRDDGSSIQNGDYAFFTDNLFRRYNGSTWVASDINTANLAASSGSSLVGFIQSGAGAIARMLQDKGRDVIHVRDFGAVGDGVADDTGALQLALNELTARGGGILVFDGVYKLTENATAGVQTRLTVSSDNVTLVFSELTKFLIKSNSFYTNVFLLAGVSNFRSIGTLRVESDATTPYTTTGSYGAKAIVINNASGGNCGDIHIDSVHLTRGSIAVSFENAYTDANRVDGVHIGTIKTVDVTYGLNSQNNGDNVSLGILETDNAYRSFFVYGGKNYKGKVRALNQHAAGTPVNITRYSVAEGGSGTNTENIDLDVEVIDGTPNVLATMRHIGDGGSGQLIKNINLRLKSNFAAGSSVISLQMLNFDTSGGASSATPFNAKIQDVFVYSDTNSPTDIIGYTPCSWVTKPNITWMGAAGTTIAKAASLQSVFSLYFHQRGSKLFIEDVNIANNVFLYGLSSAGAQQRITGIDSSNNTLFGASSAASVFSIVYGGSQGVYMNTSGTSRVRATDTDFRPTTDGTWNLGIAANRFGTVYAATGAINTSDAREKQQVRELSAAERAVAVRCRQLLRAFKFNDAVAQKGDGARIHVGVIVQEVVAAFEAEGLDPFAYAIVCHDIWDEQAEVVGDDGEVVLPFRSAGDRFGVRYEQLLAFMLAAL